TGRLFENLAAETFARKYEELFYWKSQQNDLEIDFVLKDDFKTKQLVQVCSDLRDEKTLEREVRALSRGQAELKCKNLLVVNDNKDAVEKKVWFGEKLTVQYMPMWKWLLENN
ncbi:MAG: hypothetical protein LH473_04545, partial [Chitinophagales bacterium]|nr:hypothetical protein [Chitinophagales bacterium]